MLRECPVISVNVKSLTNILQKLHKRPFTGVHQQRGYKDNKLCYDSVMAWRPVSMVTLISHDTNAHELNSSCCFWSLLRWIDWIYVGTHDLQVWRILGCGSVFYAVDTAWGATWSKQSQGISKLATFTDLEYWQVITFGFEHDYELFQRTGV